MWLTQILLAILFGAAGAMKLVRSKENAEHNHQFSQSGLQGVRPRRTRAPVRFSHEQPPPSTNRALL